MSNDFEIPTTGLSLHLGDQSGDPSVKPNQIMRLNLVQSTLDDLIQSLRKDQPARVRLGKHPSLHYGGKSQSFHAYPETHRSEIYHSSDKENLYFTGVLSHSLEVEKAKTDTAATDQALAELEEKLNAHERGKESKKTHIISHPDELRVFRNSGVGYTGPTTKVEREKDRFLKTAANRSLTASPTLGAPKSPSLAPSFAMTPTSAPVSQSKDRERLEALKVPFIHLLAVRAVSAKFLARQTRSTIEDCTALGEKFGVLNRINPEKYDLKDKVYKDLDVFGFNYTPEDRKEAIENSISAFDRMRISRSDKLWQTLLPKAERGKGKCLSRLNLHTGPPQKPVAPPAKTNGDDSSKDDTDRTTKGPATANRTTSGKGPAKDTTKRSTKTKTTNSTLTGRVTKKTGGKAPVKIDSKIKSAEFIHSSDEDDDNDTDMADAAPPAPAPAPAPAPKQHPKEHKRVPSNPKIQPPKKLPVKPRTTDTASSASAPKVKSDVSKPKLEPTKPAAKVSASKRPPSRPSTSPQKPSPLGSSPPANASDAASRKRSDSNNQSSGSSSSSPLITQLAKNNKVTRAAPAAAKTAKATAQTNGVTKTTPTVNPLKRKAEPDHLSVPQAGRPTGDLEAKRRRAASSSSGGSTGSASPPMSYELARQQLREKSQQFKNYYTKYRKLHDSLAANPNPPQADMTRLQKQHNKLQSMKEEIWEEDRRLRNGLHS
jgi:RNA polymerase II elongation factor ELL